MEKELALKIEHVSKQYRLGQIGGGTLQGDLQSWWARVRGKEDPNSKIGSKQYVKNERFWALDDVNIEVRKGEAVGIIGHNGAGKSTLLKLLSRVTAPTKGEILINGRIASMLEVGTGFHAEMTGRENIYMNGAILGMTKEEIDRKIDQIIDFSECRQFIDTPVKRYSSGMYVKLAFAVAAHLDSEIMVMDEVLAVGDMKFQQKALGRMGEAAGEEGRTVLYVSHNMATIRQLCTRCIVLDHGHVIFDGDVEGAIGIYSDINMSLSNKCILEEHPEDLFDKKAKICSLEITNSQSCIFQTNDKLVLQSIIYASCHLKKCHIRFILQLLDETNIGMTFSEDFDLQQGYNDLKLVFDMNGIPPGKYKPYLVLSQTDGFGAVERLDIVPKSISFEIVPIEGYCQNILWTHKAWGYYKYDVIKVSSL